MRPEKQTNEEVANDPEDALQRDEEEESPHYSCYKYLKVVPCWTSQLNLI